MYSRAYKTIVSLPPILWVSVFLLLPYGLMLANSFWAVREGFVVHDWNLRNYHTLFSNPVYAGVLFRTMRIAASVTLCSLLLGYPLAYYLSFHAGARKELLYQLVIVPLWVSYLVRGYAWKTILGSEGVLNGFLQYLHLTREPVAFLLYSPSTRHSNTSLARSSKPRRTLAPARLKHFCASFCLFRFPACSPAQPLPLFFLLGISSRRSLSAALPAR
jgi:ABC-type spermidine/putrescine transport system permease subunit I